MARDKKQKLDLSVFQPKEKVDRVGEAPGFDYKKPSRKFKARDGDRLRAGYDPVTDKAFRAVGRAVGVPAVTEGLRSIDENLVGLSAAERAAYNMGRGEGSGWDVLDIATALPAAGLVDKPISFAARGVRRAVAPLASKAAESAPGRAVVKRLTKPAPKPATLNIGLEPSKHIGGAPISPVEALTRLEVDLGREPKNIRRVFSQSEPTLVADIEGPLSPEEGYDLSAQLRHDAIAQHTGGGEGGLYGPRAHTEDWSYGQFNPGFFYTQGGDTLGSGYLTDLFRSGAPREDIVALADKYGMQLDPVALDINLRMRERAGANIPEQLGQFTSRETLNDPAELQAYREAERRLRERELAQLGLSDFGLRDLVPALEQLPSEDELLRTMREAQLPRIGPAPKRTEVGGRGVHISRVSGLEQIDPNFYGTGHRGEEYPRVKREALPNRSYLYVGPEGSISPEPDVLGVVGDEMRRGPRYAYESELSGLYDINADPENIRRLAQAYQLPFYKPQIPEWAVNNHLVPGSEELVGSAPSSDLERWIKDRGYAGYLSDFNGGRAAAVYGPTKVRRMSEEPITDWRRKYAEGGRV